MFIKLEQALKVTNTDYKAIRRGLNDWSKTTRSDKRTIATRLIFAVRAKLRSSDIIIDFEKWASIKNMEKATAVDPEPTISRPDINTSTNNVVLYRYLVGNDKIAMAKKFLELAKDGRGIPSPAVQAYLPVIEMIDDLVQAGPAYIAQLRALHKRAKKDY